MTIELFFARTWIVLCATLAVTLQVASTAVLYYGLRKWIRGEDKDINTNVWIAQVVAFTLLYLLCAIMDVGQAFPMLDKADEITWLISPVLAILVTGKTMTKFQSIKHGTLESVEPTKSDGK